MTRQTIKKQLNNTNFFISELSFWTKKKEYKLNNKESGKNKEKFNKMDK